MRLALWYKVLLLVWVVFGIPVLVLAYGFGGGRFELPDPEYTHFVDMLGWGIGMALVLSPVLSAPFGIRLSRGRAETPKDIR